VPVYALAFGCLAASAPTVGAGPAEVAHMTTVAYYEGKDADPAEHRLDLFRPDGHTDAPVLLFFHGGVWQRGDKREYGNIGEAFARRGILTAIVNYRLTPSVRHPGHVQDAARAVAWALRHVAEYGGRTDRIFLSGHSAGGHLVTLLLFDPQYLRAESVDPEQLAGVIALSGVFDLTMPIDDTSEGGFAPFIYPPFGRDPKALDQASPIRHLHSTRVPLLIVVAGEDYRDMRAQSRGFADALERTGIPARFETIPGRGHFQLVQAIGTAGDPTTDLVTRFISTPAAR
jgi:arylformamidase